MIGIAAFDFILWIVFSCVMRITFVIKILRMNFNNRSRNSSGFRIPVNFITNFKLSFHRYFFKNVFATLCQIEDSAEPKLKSLTKFNRTFFFKNLVKVLNLDKVNQDFSQNIKPDHRQLSPVQYKDVRSLFLMP